MFEIIYIPYSTKEGIDYLIKFTPFSSEKLPENINIPIVDIVIETNAESHKITNSAHSLMQITQIISDYALNNNAIYYCYCSDKPVKRAERKKHLSNQEYRSLLFSKMFQKNNNASFINKIVVIKDSEKGNHYIHLITNVQNENMLGMLAELLFKFEK